MEIMHSKFLKLQTALLSVLLLFSVLLPQTALAAGGTTNATAAQDTVTLVDPNTFNSWEKIQGTRSITQGRIWADKTVSDNEIKFSPHSPLGESGQTVSKTAGSDFLVALSALSSTSSLTKPEPQPIDIVLVLDASGSMSDPMGRNDSTKRIDALKAAANNFLAAAKKQNDEIEDPAKQIKVSIVKFAGDKTDKVGNDKYRDGGYWYNHSQIMRNLTLCNNTYLSTLQDVVDSISPAGATRSDYGMELAQTALGNASARSNAKKVVIFFTDGKPTSRSDYNAKVAGGAINTAKTLKDSGTTIYTVGIFSGADSSNPPAMPGQDEKKLANRFMHAVSSNYPAASSSGNDWDGYTVSMGNRAENSNYYKTATKSKELDAVFQDIFKDATSDPPVPTLVEKGKNATESGYVTFEDPLGDYMTVTGFNAIAFSDKIYTAPTKETRGNVTTYTFTGTNKGNVAYPQNVDLDNIIITVTHDTNLQTGDKVKVEIPAALLPLRYYNIAEDKDGKISMEITPTYPIHVFYSVSLKDAAKQQMESGVITDTALASYVAAHIEEGDKAYFYSNLYTGARKGKDDKGNPYTAGNTTASFVPAKTNSFYYYTEDTPLYEDEDCTNPAKNVQPNTPYYYDMPYYQTGIENANGSLKLQHAHIKVSIATQEEINDTLKKDKDGLYYVPKGTLKGSYPQALDNQLGGKEENITNTASRRIDFGWDYNYTIGCLYLGNNGKIGYNATGSLKITKKVDKADPSYSPDAATQFGIQVDLKGNGANGTYTYTIDGNASDSYKFKSGAVITLKNGQTAEIEGLPAGCKYTVSEPTLPDGYTSSIDPSAGVIAAGKVQDTAPVVTVTNTYKPSDAVLNGSTNLAGEKILNGRAWLASDQFDFQLEAVDAKNTPMPEVSLIQLKQGEGTAAGTPVPFHFGDITYTKPGTYIYDINEIIPSNGIIGISYDSTIYRVTVTVTDDQKGHLTAAASMQNLSDKSTAELATFTNTFAAKDETLVLEAIKQFVDKGGNALTQTSGQFNFKLDKSQVDENNNQLPADHDPPMPASADAASNALGRVTYVLNYNSTHDLAKTYYYQLSEVNEGLKNITYSNERYLIKVTFTVETEDGETALQAHPTYYKWDDAQKWVQLDHQDSESGMTFTNTFTGTTTAKLSIGKILAGRNWMEGDTFTFTLIAKGNAPMPEGENANKLTITNESNKVMDDERLGSFGDITFTQPGTYEYTISEDTVTLPGFKNHPGDITATVTVTRNGNELTSTVSYKDAAGKVNEAGYGYFTNTYSPDSYKVSTSVLFNASKTLEGRGWLPEENFTFVLTGDESNPVDTPMPDFCEAVANSSHTTVTLGDNADLTFTKPGIYTYYITEKKESTPGLIYDTSKYKVVVTVEDKDADGGNIGKSGKLTGSVQYFKGTLGENGEYTFSDKPEAANIAAFTNTYTTEPATLNGDENLSVTKKLVGREWGNEESFTFEIAVADGSAENTPLPSEKTLTLTKPTPNGDTATGHFGDITYTKPGTYSYTISEVRGTDNTAAITQWDDSVYTVNVTVEDNGAGKLRITDVKVESDGSNYSGISFTNRYEADPNPTKTVTDESRNNIDNTLVSPGQKLTYTIHWVNNAVDATGKYTPAEITVTDTVPANTTFDSADNGGTWDKTDNKVTWKFTADPNTEGNVSFTVKVNESISGENGEINNSALVGNRTTNTTHNYLPGKTADKDANTTLKVGDELTYTIKYKNLEDAAATVTVTDAVPAGTEFVSADNGGVCKNGTVTWNIADVTSGTEGSVSFKVRVTIDAVGRSIENQAQVKIGDHNPVTTTKTENKNIEKPSPASVTLTACKTLISDVGNHTLAAGEFAFTLLDKDGKLVQTAPNDAEGNVTFDALSLDTIDEYTYTICEVDGNVGYITYDGSRYTVTFSVYATKDGTLAATKPVYSLNGKTVDAAEFTNHYTAELPAGTSFSLSATKTLTGRSIIDGEFFFTLEDEGGNIVATASSDAEGNIQFPAVGLKNVQAAYTALLAAAEPVQPAAEPTPAEDEQPVKIENGEQAPLETAVAANSLEGTPAVVTDAEPETKLDVAPETDSETEPKTDPETEPKTEPAPTVDTDAVQALLTRWYTIREYAQGKDGVTYDANTYMVRVQLADKEGQGTLIVDSIQFFAADGETPLDNSAVVFNNSYAAEGVDLTVTAQKQLTGRSMADGEFSFRLSCNDDPANEQTVTSDANGRIAFALHYDDKDGTGTQETHTYTVTEVRGDNDTITYDDTAYTFTVEVIDDGTGHLTTKVTQPEAMVFRNVYTPKATSITLAGNKVLNGRAQKAGEFTFELCDANGAVIATAANGENGYFAFPALSYDEAGEYTYTVREKDTGVGRVTYDKTVYSVTVQVRDEDGQLKADIILPASGLTFTNTYTPEPAQTPAPTPKPTTSPAPAATAAPTPAPARIPQTADSFPLALLIGLLAVSGGALAVLLTARKRGKK